MLRRRKEFVILADFFCFRGLHCKNDGKRNDSQELRSYQRTEKDVEHKGDGDTNCSWCTWNGPLKS